MSQTKGSGPRSAQDTTAEYASPEPGDCFFLVCNYGSSNIGKVRESLPPPLQSCFSDTEFTYTHPLPADGAPCVHAFEER